MDGGPFQSFDLLPLSRTSVSDGHADPNRTRFEVASYALASRRLRGLRSRLRRGGVEASVPHFGLPTGPMSRSVSRARSSPPRPARPPPCDTRAVKRNAWISPCPTQKFTHPI